MTSWFNLVRKDSDLLTYITLAKVADPWLFGVLQLKLHFWGDTHAAWMEPALAATYSDETSLVMVIKMR